ncbi:hypothetical protein NG829_08385 [Xanthomonas sacchari]|uniref:hypothetical protein n=1 Tax=Xanthomonas sacchari TaxID=56458 RepID=UPI00225E6BC2|nr:hypothetical protein [Xanthomonas sacchari]UYK82293.1 hypothetical protein NG829_08385 [Xanthomonas sacchari]
MQSHSQGRALRLVVARWEQAGRAKRSTMGRFGSALTHLRDAVVIGLLACAVGAAVDGLTRTEEHRGHNSAPSINVEEVRCAEAQRGRSKMVGSHAVNSSACSEDAHEG